MTFRKTQGGIVEIVARAKRRYPPAMFAAGRVQFCRQESDRRLREKIRAMDRREQLIVLDELQKICEEQEDAV